MLHLLRVLLSVMIHAAVWNNIEHAHARQTKRAGQD